MSKSYWSGRVPKAGFLFSGLTFGGVERWMYYLATKCRSVRFTSMLIEGHYYSPEVIKDFDFLKIYSPHPEKGIRKVESILDGVRRVRDEIDFLVAAAGTKYLPEIEQEFKKPILLVSHGANSATATNIQQNVYGASYYAAVSKTAANSFPESVRDKVSIIYNGVDSFPYRMASLESKQQARRILGLEDNLSYKYLLQVGRFSKEKNPQALLQAISNLPPYWKGILVGSGPLEQQLKIEASTYVPDRIFFSKPDANIPLLMRACDCYLLASDTEAFPLVLVEAWMSKLPVVMSEIPLLLEIASWGNFVQPVPIRASSKILGDVIDCFVTKNYLDCLSGSVDKAYEFANKTLSLEGMVSQWDNLFTHILANENTGDSLKPVPSMKASNLYHL